MTSEHRTCMIIGLLLIVQSSILHGQITLTTVTDPQLSNLRPTNIKVGLNGETLLMKDRKIYTYTDQLTNVFDCSICGDIQDVAFVGDTMYIANGTAGIVKRFGDSTLQVNPLRTTKLISDNGGNLFGIKHLDGIVVWDGSDWQHMTTSNSSIQTNTIYDMAVDDNGILWMASHVGLISWNGTTFSLTSVPGDLSEALYDIEIDSTGNIWVASAFGGLGKFDGVEWTTYPETFDVLHAVQNLGILNNDEVWTSDSGDGLYRYSAGAFEFIPYEDLGQTGWQINRVLYGDAQNRLWIANDFTPLMYLTTGPTAIDDIKPTNAGLSVYPNPATDKIYFQFDTPFKGEFQVMAYNINGVLVFQGNFLSNQETNVDVKYWLPGMYEVIIRNEGKIFGTRICVLPD